MIAGYLEFVALLFLPGLAFMDLFRLGTSSSFSERITIAWGLSMAVVTSTLFIRTSGAVVAGQVLRGFGGLSLILILTVSLVVWVTALILRRGSVFITHLSRWDLAVLVLIAIQSALLLAHFAKFPIFPPSESVDFQQTASLSRSIQSGQVASVPGGVLYYGVHLLIGSLLVLSSSSPLIASQQALAVIAALSPLMVYTFVLSLGLSKRTALYAAIVYVGTGIVWYGMLFISGLYANFYGVLSVMLMIILLHAARSEPGKLRSWIAFGAGVANLYISHYSAITILPVVLVLFLLQTVLDRKVDRPLLLATAILFMPVVAAIALFPGLPGTLLSFLSPSPINSVIVSTPLSNLLSAFPFVSYVVTEMTNDVVSIMVLATAAVGVAASLKKKAGMLFLPALWFLVLLLSAPLNETAWRFSFVALMPLTVLSAMGLDRLGPSAQPQLLKKRKRSLGGADHNYRALIPIVLVLVMVPGSETAYLVTNSATGTAGSALAQRCVFQAMQWASNNTQVTGGIVSPTEVDFIYTRIAVGRPGVAIAMISPDRVVEEANSSGWAYVAMTNYVTLPGALEGYVHLEKLYSSDSRFKLVYQNLDVSLYQILVNSTS